MALPDGDIIELILVTGEDALAADFAAGLQERAIGNPVLRMNSFQACLDHLQAMPSSVAGRVLPIIILDLGSAPREGMRFLNEVHVQRPFNEPVIFIVGAGDHEAEILTSHARFVAGQLPESGAGTAFVDWGASMLSSNWSFEDSQTDT